MSAPGTARASENGNERAARVVDIARTLRDARRALTTLWTNGRAIATSGGDTRSRTVKFSAAEKNPFTPPRARRTLPVPFRSLA